MTWFCVQSRQECSDAGQWDCRIVMSRKYDGARDGPSLSVICCSTWGTSSHYDWSHPIQPCIISEPRTMLRPRTWQLIPVDLNYRTSHWTAWMTVSSVRVSLRSTLLNASVANLTVHPLPSRHTWVVQKRSNSSGNASVTVCCKCCHPTDCKQCFPNTLPPWLPDCCKYKLVCHEIDCCTG